MLSECERYRATTCRLLKTANVFTQGQSTVIMTAQYVNFQNMELLQLKGLPLSQRKDIFYASMPGNRDIY